MLIDRSFKTQSLNFKFIGQLLEFKVSDLNFSNRLEISKSQGLNFEFNEIVETFISKTWNFRIGFQMLNKKTPLEKTVIYGPLF